MTSRERFLAAARHTEPDLLPIDFGSTQVTTITRIAYQNLRGYLGMEPDVNPRISHRQMDTVYPTESFFRHYKVDFRPVTMKSTWASKARQTDGADTFYDEYNIRWKKASYYYDVIERPLANATLSDLAAIEWPDARAPGRVDGVREEAQRLFEQTDFALVADIMCGGPFEQSCNLRGYDNYLIDIYENPRFARKLIEMVTDVDIAFWEVFLEAVGDFVQVVTQGDDLGMQTNTFISRETYRDLVKPCHTRMYDFIHSRTDAKIMMHSCGSVYDLIPEFIDVGVDILNPLQTSAAKMDLARIKGEFGRDLCFWGGGIDVQQTLPFATLAEIEDTVRRTIDIMAPGGGYVFVPAHNIQADIAPERIDTVYRTALARRARMQR
jgi:uroporphyrinogen decarboxylase